ncbi:MAG TPA: protein kinase [Gemmatimonadales bacterium]|nr:protein kinase [Gemmatimonadales bacterium]
MNAPELEDVQRAVGDHYEVLDLAGVGGMGAVFRARHRTLGHLVAVKVLPPDVATSQMRQDRFKREASLAAQLSHPNIVPVYEFDTREGLSFLIMPFVRGRTLESALVERQQVPVREILRLLREIGAALDAAHRRGVVHRDVKPANIMIEEDSGRLLLTDFGVAQIRTVSGALTAPGSVIGTPDYMSPEQMVGSPDVDGRADLYSLGLIAFEALTGTRPSLGADRATLARSLRGARPEIPGSLATALVAPLADSREERPSKAAEWLTLIDRATSSPWPRLAAVAVAAVALGGAIWFVLGQRGSRPTNGRSLAVMPFTVIGATPDVAEQLPEYFLGRFSPVPGLTELSFRQVRAVAGAQPLSNTEADSIAALLGARYFVTASVAYAGRSMTFDAKLYKTGAPDPVTTVTRTGVEDSINAVMDAAWGEILSAIGAVFRPNPHATIPRDKDAIASFLNGDGAFRRGDYERARTLYDAVIARDTDFALAYLRRVLTLAQVAPDEDSLRHAMLQARHHLRDLQPSDSLLLEGYADLVERGDGPAALAHFRDAANLASDPIWPRFVQGEFYLYFGQVFDQTLDSARAAFDDVLDLDPGFAAAIANSISLAHFFRDHETAQRLIRQYHSIDSISVVAEVVGLADTLLYQNPKFRPAVLRSLDRRPFTVLMYLAFQAAQFGSDAERQGPERHVLQALARRAATDRERTLALRLGVAADLREGWADSARARLAAAPPSAARERDQWIVLAQALRLPPLGDPASSRRRLVAWAAADRDTSATLAWLLALTAPQPGPNHSAPLRLSDSAPLPASLALDLQARAALRHADTANALALWSRSITRYAVLAAPLGLVASLWPLRRDLAQVAWADHDTTMAARACRTFDALIGFADQAVRPEMEPFCAPLLAVPLPE